MITPNPTTATFVVCEDGHEYSQRFERLLGGRFVFVRAGDFAEALLASRHPVAGLLLDLDFRRTPPAALVNEAGALAGPPGESERRRLAGMQGILILRALRAASVRLPALLFADLDDQAQVQFLESSLTPLTVVPSSAGLPQIAAALAAMAAGPR